MYAHDTSVENVSGWEKLCKQIDKKKQQYILTSQEVEELNRNFSKIKWFKVFSKSDIFLFSFFDNNG